MQKELGFKSPKNSAEHSRNTRQKGKKMRDDKKHNYMSFYKKKKKSGVKCERGRGENNKGKG